MAIITGTCTVCGKKDVLFDIEGDICVFCSIKRREDRWDKICKGQIADGVTEFTGEDVIRCPWCGERQDFEESDDVLYSGESHVKCQCCGQKFTVNAEACYTYDMTRGWGENK